MNHINPSVQTVQSSLQWPGCDHQLPNKKNNDLRKSRGGIKKSSDRPPIFRSSQSSHHYTYENQLLQGGRAFGVTWLDISTLCKQVSKQGTPLGTALGIDIIASISNSSVIFPISHIPLYHYTCDYTIDIQIVRHPVRAAFGIFQFQLGAKLQQFRHDVTWDGEVAGRSPFISLVGR